MLPFMHICPGGQVWPLHTTLSVAPCVGVWDGTICKCRCRCQPAFAPANRPGLKPAKGGIY